MDKDQEQLEQIRKSNNNDKSLNSKSLSINDLEELLLF